MFMFPCRLNFFYIIHENVFVILPPLSQVKFSRLGLYRWIHRSLLSVHSISYLVSILICVRVRVRVRGARARARVCVCVCVFVCACMHACVLVIINHMKGDIRFRNAVVDIRMNCVDAKVCLMMNRNHITTDNDFLHFSYKKTAKLDDAGISFKCQYNHVPSKH